jgi:hypothetical protein
MNKKLIIVALGMAALVMSGCASVATQRDLRDQNLDAGLELEEEKDEKEDESTAYIRQESGTGKHGSTSEISSLILS